MLTITGLSQFQKKKKSSGKQIETFHSFAEQQF
jgi:hypothetical protein